MSLASWLLEQIAEDERCAELLIESDQRIDRWIGVAPPPVRDFAERFGAVRVLAECEAKRRIVEVHADVNDGNCGVCVIGDWGYPSDGGCRPSPSPCVTLRLLALPYAVRPGYREEWRP